MLGWGLISILHLCNANNALALSLSVSFSHLHLCCIIIVMPVKKTVQGLLCTVCCHFCHLFFLTNETVMWVTCGHYSLSLCFHRQCHLLAAFALCANHFTSVSKIHVPSQSQIALKCLSAFLWKKKNNSKKRKKKILKKPCFGS